MTVLQSPEDTIFFLKSGRVLKFFKIYWLISMVFFNFTKIETDFFYNWNFKIGQKIHWLFTYSKQRTHKSQHWHWLFYPEEHEGAEPLWSSSEPSTKEIPWNDREETGFWRQKRRKIRWWWVCRMEWVFWQKKCWMETLSVGMVWKNDFYAWKFQKNRLSLTFCQKLVSAHFSNCPPPWSPSWTVPYWPVRTTSYSSSQSLRFWWSPAKKSSWSRVPRRRKRKKHRKDRLRVAEESKFSAWDPHRRRRTEWKRRRIRWRRIRHDDGFRGGATRRPRWRSRRWWRWKRSATELAKLVWKMRFFFFRFPYELN